MIPKKNRLTAHEVRALKAGGRVMRVPGFLVHFSYSTAEMPARFAVTVSSKNVKNRVQRHTQTRAIYHALAPHIPHIPPGRYCIHLTDRLTDSTIHITVPRLLERITVRA